jgi:type II secretory ATPase GspE/PulE/Tfp pilus assembly ATPase PilB-like protein
MSEIDSAARYRGQDENATQQRAAILGLRYLDTRGLAATAELFTGVLTNDEMYRYRIIPLRVIDGEVFVFGITSSTPQTVIKQLTDKYSSEGHAAEFLLISNLGFKDYMLRYDPPPEVHYDDVKISQTGDSDTIKAVSDTLETVKSDDLLDYLIDQSDRLKSSDIHIENQQNDVRIRFRVDGTLHPIATISHDKYRTLLASIATRANITTMTSDAQTGHMSAESQAEPGRQINMRIETVPAAYGQDVVLRLFDFKAEMLDLDRLGLDDQKKHEIDEIISHPHGMVMVVGPTGSGKSTTLYSMLNALNSTTRKIITLEDPVEVNIPGVTQIPVNTTSGDSFAEKLRAVLRLDPDIVMVGEIRDSDTAKTAIQASVTGHLVLSTFHASDSASAFTRLIDIIGQNPIFSSSIRLVIAQRLVRRLDDSTKVRYTPDESTKNWIKDILRDLPDNVSKPDLDNIQLYKPGSSPEKPFGYDGRIVIMEQLIVTDKIKKFIRDDIKNIDTSLILSAAKEQGMVTMQQEGVLRALRGETTIEEINRVI